MHDLQKKILELARKQNIRDLSLRQIGRIIGAPEKNIHPQSVQHHLEQLVKKGLLLIDEVNNSIIAAVVGRKSHDLVSIPIVGSANCGKASVVAEENIEGFIKVSPSMLDNKTSGVFAIHAIGDSMNMARIGANKRNIADGDYVVIDYENRCPENNDYILSVIDGAANLKKYVKDDENRQIILKSESTNDYPPIFIDENDLDCFFVNGKVIQVIKNPK